MKKKVLSLVLVLAMMFSLCITAGAEEPAEDLSGSIIILHTNDVHGAIDGYAKASALKKTYEEMGAYVLLMDAGDFIQGDPTVSTSEGATAVELMNLAGYDVAAPGNHEFDYGYANLKALVSEADFPIVAANVLYGGKAAFNDNVTFTAPDGTKIGVFGLDTPETATKAHPAKIKGVTFLADDELFACAQEQVNELEAEGCDIIVCLGHLGIDDESTGNRSMDLLEEVDGIDLFIDGHSHSYLDDIAGAVGESCMVNDTILTSTGTKFENIGLVVISDGVMEATAIPTADITVKPDGTVADRAAAIQKAVDDEYGAVFAKTEVELNGVKAEVRTGETNLGNLITDALVWGAAEAGTKVDAAVTNGGGIRASISKGGITKKDINTVLPFGNTLSIVKVTGAELLEALEASTYCTPTAIGGFPQVSGIVYTVDTTKAFDQGKQYPGSTYYAPKTINRVTIQSVGGKAFDAKTTYTIATNDFMAAGGDTYYAFKTASVNYDLGVPMDEVVMEYVTEELDGVVAGLDLLRGVNKGSITALEGDTVVIGGGNAAIDVARTALRLGKGSVNIYCLEKDEEMPTVAEEKNSGLSDGVIINNSWAPKRILGEGGKVTGIELMRCLSVRDAQGKFAPVYDESETITVPCSNVLVAIGQRSDYGAVLAGTAAETADGRLVDHDKVTFQTAEPDIFVGGDCATGPMYTIDAIASGREGAVSIHRFVNVGQTLTIHRNLRDFKELDKSKVVLPVESVRKPARNEPAIDKAKSLTMCDDRVTFTEEQIKSEASRCLSCGRSVVDPNKCIGCGICTTRCEFDAIHLTRNRPQNSKMIPAEDKFKAIAPYAAKRQVKIIKKQPSGK